MVKNKRILITGFAGSIGSELARQLCVNNKIFGLDNNETDTFSLAEDIKQKGYWIAYRVGDVRNKETVKDVFSDFKPQVVFHAAAYKHVSPMEKYPEEAVETNILGTLNVLQEARRWECLEKFVFISTDKAVSPHSIMGATKRVGEIIVKNAGYTVVRFGNVLGSRGSVIPIWQKQINEGQALTITDERMERYMMTIEEACELVIRACEISKGGEIFVLDMGKRINILDFAKKIMQEARIDLPLKIIGIRPGEQLVEEIMFEEEKKRAIKQGKFFIINGS